MSNDGVDNRRTSRRATIAFDLKVEADSSEGHQFYTGLIKDMSSGGLFIATQGHLPRLKDRFSIRFSFPPQVEEPVEVTVEVCWQRMDENNPEFPTGVGVKFVDLPPAIEEKLNLFLKDKDVLLYDDDEYSEWGETEL